MSITLTKGANVSLSKAALNLKQVIVGLGWQEETRSGRSFDLDASAIMLGRSGKVLSDQHFVFYGNLQSPDGAIVHAGDNLVGTSGLEPEDAERIHIDLTLLPEFCESIVFPVSIYEPPHVRPSQFFGEVRGAFVRVMNAEGEEELARYDLAEDASTETAMVFGEVYRHGSEWKFRAVGQGYDGGLRAICLHYGINVE